MKKFFIGVGLLVSVFFVAGNALAIPVTFGDGGVALQGVLDGITTAPVAGDSSVNVNADQLAYDAYWSITGAGGSVSTMIIEIASFATSNIFGVYSGGQYVQLFSGAQAAGAQALLSIKSDGSVFVNFGDTGVDFAGNNFGFYLDSSMNAAGILSHSDTALNADGLDHLAVYQGTNTDDVALPGLAPGLWTNNEYILAWEDLYGGGDRDYTDMVVMVESVNPNPVPEPATILLMGVGLIGLAGYSRKKLNKKS